MVAITRASIPPARKKSDVRKPRKISPPVIEAHATRIRSAPPSNPEPRSLVCCECSCAASVSGMTEMIGTPLTVSTSSVLRNVRFRSSIIKESKQPKPSPSTVPTAPQMDNLGQTSSPSSGSAINSLTKTAKVLGKIDISQTIDRCVSKALSGDRLPASSLRPATHISPRSLPRVPPADFVPPGVFLEQGANSSHASRGPRRH